jgi:hypothetical protein
MCHFIVIGLELMPRACNVIGARVPSRCFAKKLQVLISVIWRVLAEVLDACIQINVTEPRANHFYDSANSFGGFDFAWIPL